MRLSIQYLRGKLTPWLQSALPLLVLRPTLSGLARACQLKLVLITVTAVSPSQPLFAPKYQLPPNLPEQRHRQAKKMEGRVMQAMDYLETNPGPKENMRNQIRRNTQRNASADLLHLSRLLWIKTNKIRELLPVIKTRQSVSCFRRTLTRCHL